MAAAVTMPKMGLTMREGTVNAWMKAEGEPVAQGEDIVEIANDKVSNVLQSPADGVVLKILAEEGDVVPVGAVLGWVGAEGEAIPEAGAPQAAPATTAQTSSASVASGGGPQAKSERVKISPAARKLAEANGLDVAALEGTGPGGRITREDVERAIQG